MLFLLLPGTAAAHVPLEGFFIRTADRLGITPEARERMLTFAGSLRDDVLIDYAIASAYPPVFEITFASGKAIRADGRGIRLSDYDFDDDDDDGWLFEDYAGLCILIFSAGFLLFWTGFFTISLQLAITGAELVIFVLALCL